MSCVNHPEADAAIKCVSCGAGVCETCRVDLNDNNSYCKKCILEKAQIIEKPTRSPILATVLGFFIGGSGQIYNGQTGKGIMIFFTSWLIIPWLYGIFDAYLTAKKINQGLIKVQPRSGCATAALVGALVMLIIIPVLGILTAIAIPNVMRARQLGLANQGGGVIKIDLGAIIVDKLEETAKKLTENSAGKKSKSTIDQILNLASSETFKVYMRNGHIFEASIEKETADMYVFKIGNGTFQVNKNDIEELKKLK